MTGQPIRLHASTHLPGGSDPISGVGAIPAAFIDNSGVEPQSVPTGISSPVVSDFAGGFLSKTADGSRYALEADTSGIGVTGLAILEAGTYRFDISSDLFDRPGFRVATPWTTHAEAALLSNAPAGVFFYYRLPDHGSSIGMTHSTAGQHYWNPVQTVIVDVVTPAVGYPFMITWVHDTGQTLDAYAQMAVYLIDPIALP